MSKTVHLNLRVDELLKQKIDAAAGKENTSISTFVRQTLEEKSDQILMGESPQERDPILLDILDRIVYVQADLMYESQGIKKSSAPAHDENLKSMGKKVTDQYRNE